MQGLGRFLAVQESWKNFMWKAKPGRKRAGARKEEPLYKNVWREQGSERIQGYMS